MCIFTLGWKIWVQIPSVNLHLKVEIFCLGAQKDLKKPKPWYFLLWFGFGWWCLCSWFLLDVGDIQIALPSMKWKPQICYMTSILLSPMLISIKNIISWRTGRLHNLASPWFWDHLELLPGLGSLLEMWSSGPHPGPTDSESTFKQTPQVIRRLLTCSLYSK